MASEAYRRVGRGGAGNFYAQKDIDSAAKAENKASKASSSAAAAATAQHSSIPRSHSHATSTSPPALSTITTTTSPPLPSYQHTGRGGAGNFIQPGGLISSGLTRVSTSPYSPDPAASSATYFSPRAQKRGTSVVVTKSGRGGAGNFEYPSPESGSGEEDVDGEESDIRRQRREAIERDVELGLRRPPRAQRREETTRRDEDEFELGVMRREAISR